ncbi:ABC transporter ATP-binding protein [Leptospira sp. 96542]|nr:ABC transporter ATP-binding protein [Leptospira sp. 96542]
MAVKLFWKFLRPYWLQISLALFFLAVAQGLALYDPVIFGKIIDGYGLKTLDGELPIEIIHLLWLAIGIALVSLFFFSLKDFTLRLIIQRFGMDVFNEGLRHTLRLPYQDFEEESSGEILAVLVKVKNDTEKFLTALINVFFSSLIGICFLVWYATSKHWALVPVFMFAFFVLGSITAILSRSIKTLQRSLMRQNRQMSGTITESLRNIELVKSLGLTYSEIRRLKQHTFDIYSGEMEKVKKMRTLSFLQGSILIILKQSILYILLWLIFRKLLSPGELISMQFISIALIGPLQDLGNIIVSFREAETALTQLNGILNKPVEYSPEEWVDVGQVSKLSFNNVVFRHRSASFNAIQNISFEAKLGDTLAFVGPSGSGKSTLLKLLVGLYRPLGGDIFYDGISINDLRYNHIRRQIGFVTQDTQLFYGSIRDNLLFVKPEATEVEMMEALTAAAAISILENSPNGLDTVLGESGRKLSGGEKQRLSIARALLRKPRILIFDEATSALDSITEEQISKTIRNISANKHQITILIAHRLSTVMHADTIFVLERGAVIERGDHSALLDKKGLYFALWRQQLGERNFQEEAGNQLGLG